MARELFAGKRNGLPQRFGLAIAPDTGLTEWADAVADKRALDDLAHAMQTVYRLRPECRPGSSGVKPGRILMSIEAREVFRDFWRRNNQRLNPDPEQRGSFDNHLSKYRGLFLRLCLVRHMMQMAFQELDPNPGEVAPRVTGETARAVANFIENYLLAHARKIYDLYGNDDRDPEARRVAKWILDKRPTQFQNGAIGQNKWEGLRNAEQIEEALSCLETSYGWVRVVRQRGKNGQQRTFYAVNPRVYDMYPEP